MLRQLGKPRYTPIDCWTAPPPEYCRAPPSVCGAPNVTSLAGTPTAKPTALSRSTDQPTASRSFRACETSSAVCSSVSVSVGVWPFDFCQACVALRTADAELALDDARRDGRSRAGPSRTSPGVIASARRRAVPSVLRRRPGWLGRGRRAGQQGEARHRQATEARRPKRMAERNSPASIFIDAAGTAHRRVCIKSNLSPVGRQVTDRLGKILCSAGSTGRCFTVAPAGSVPRWLSPFQLRDGPADREAAAALGQTFQHSSTQAQRCTRSADALERRRRQCLVAVLAGRPQLEHQLHPRRRFGVGLARRPSSGASRSRRRFTRSSAGLLGRARVERRLRIVFEHELDRLGDFLARQLGRDREAEIDAGRHAAARRCGCGRAPRARRPGWRRNPSACRATPSGRPTCSP